MRIGAGTMPAMRHPAPRVLLAVLAVGAGSGCPDKEGRGPEIPDNPALAGAPRCRPVQSSRAPMVVDWPATEKAQLEATAAKGLVVVRYEGCELEVLSDCRVVDHEGALLIYDRTPLSPKDEVYKIDDLDALYAKMPVGAAGLEAKLERSGSLAVTTTVAGVLEAPELVEMVEYGGFDPERLQGRCDGATHAIVRAKTGAYELTAGAATKAGGSVEVGQAGAGGSRSRSIEILSRDGDPARCHDPDRPARSCDALLQIEVVGLQRCRGGDFEACVEDCEAGDVDACMNASYVGNPMFSKLDNGRLLKRGCELTIEQRRPDDDGEACLTYVSAAAYGEIETPDDSTQLVALIEAQCKRGLVGACHFLGELHIAAEPADPSLDMPSACEEYREPWYCEPLVPFDAERARTLFEFACHNEDSPSERSSACGDWAYAADYLEQPEEELRALEAACFAFPTPGHCEEAIRDTRKLGREPSPHLLDTVCRAIRAHTDSDGGGGWTLTEDDACKAEPAAEGPK